VHIFVHRGLPYHFEVRGDDDWMTKYFFAGGTMPSQDLLLHFQSHLSIQAQWFVNGNHYSRTLEDWLKRHDAAKAAIMPLFATTYGTDQALKWFVYWRLFYLACSELFAYRGGEEWGVGHYLFIKEK
jgi:cyclopropane-fatty-acyl-phospholipid synthase